jgi:Domain of unknown function (DUF4349)
VDPFRDDTDFAAELRALRPAARPAFAAALDERAAAGFPRRSSAARSPLGRLAARARALPPRRLALSAGATALATLTVATAIVAVNESEPTSLTATSHGGRPGSANHSEAHAAGTLRPFSRALHPQVRRYARSYGGGDQYEAALPSLAGSAVPKAKSSGGASAGRESESGTSYNGAASSYNGNAAFNLNRASHRKTGPYVFPAHRRDVERSAQMVLGTDPSEVADDAARVFKTVNAYDGIVLSSSVSSGGAGAAGARFELLIPSGRLGDALAAFSGIAEVRSRHDASDDITAPTVGLGEELQDSRAKIAGLLVQLAGADTASERAEVEAELHAERRHAASLRSQVTKLDRRANLSRVSLRIESGAVSVPGGSGGDWGVGDALGGAGHILGIAAGVAVVGIAILVPLALIALLCWLASRVWLRRGRERALD